MEKTPSSGYFVDEVSPTGEELRAWAYADAVAPWEDFHMVLDGEGVLPVVIECTEDAACPAKDFLLSSMYCTVGHLQPHDRERVRALADDARKSQDPAVRTWAIRTVAVIDGQAVLHREEWCGFPSLARTNPIEF